MITCKEDLFGKYIPVNSADEASLVKSVCENLGVKVADWEEVKYDMDSKFALISHSYRTKPSETILFDVSYKDDEDTMREFCNLSRLEIADLLPTTYENTKVYSLDEDVIRKYAELCGLPYNHDTTHRSGEYVGVSCDLDDVARFTDDSYVAIEASRTTTLTPEQILAAWDLKFKKGDTQGFNGRCVVINESPKTRAEYVKVTDSIFDLRADFEAGELYSNHGHYQINMIDNLADCLMAGNVCRRVEIEISERDLFIEEMGNLIPGFDKRTNNIWIGKIYDSGKFKLID